MDEMRLKDYDEFRSPNKKPWLLVLLVLLVVIVVLQLRNRPEKSDDEEPKEPGPAVEEVDVSADTTPVVDLAPAPDGDVKAMLAQAGEMFANSALVPARGKYLSLLAMNLSPKVRAQVEQELGKINIVLATTPRPWPEYKVNYVVKSGNSVERIAKRFGTTIDLVKQGNRLEDANLIKQGDLFRILKVEFSIKTSKSRNDLVVYMNGEFFKRYRVGTGKFGKTPTGDCLIDDKQKEPVWWRPNGKQVPFTGDPKGDNILGTRWMSLKYVTEGTGYGGYGIHGTWNNASIGKAESAGCIRMRNSDVEELYMLLPLGTKVTIVE